jgi:hypothetical protein
MVDHVLVAGVANFYACALQSVGVVFGLIAEGIISGGVNMRRR